MYADYEFYTGEYGGTLSEEDFTKYANRASCYIDSYTLDKAYGYYQQYVDDETEEGVRRLKKLEMACCSASDVIAKYEASVSVEASGNAVYQSETVGAHSVSYRTGADMEKSLREQLNGILAVYLAGTGLLYRGIPVCIHRMW